MVHTLPVSILKNMSMSFPAPCNTTIVDLVFIVDSSGSICQNQEVTTCPNWELMTAFVALVVEELVVDESNAHVGLIKFSSATTVILELNRYAHIKSCPTCHIEPHEGVFVTYIP